MKYIYLLTFSLLVQSIFGQTKMPIIKATSKTVAIKDDTFLDKGAWSLSPETKPDVYTADRTRKTKWVVFYTDIDSIKVKVKPGTKFNFIILLNGKDTCYTQIASAISLEQEVKSVENKHDTIPFTLTKYNAIHVKALVNDRDSVNLHFDIGSFDFRLTQDAILKRTQLLAHQLDAVAGKTKPNFGKMEKVFKIQMGSLSFQNPNFRTTLVTAHEMDGRFGWNIFEGKVVEIDYDKSIIIIHSEMPKHTKGYAKSKIDFIRSYVCIKGALNINHKKYEGDFLLDTGSDQALFIDSVWAKKQNLPTDLKLIKLSSFRDPRGVKYDSKTVLCPSFSTHNFSVQNVPTTLMLRNPTGIDELNLLGNDFLKRFNTLLDFKNDYIYLKINELAKLPFKEGI